MPSSLRLRRRGGIGIAAFFVRTSSQAAPAAKHRQGSERIGRARETGIANRRKRKPEKQTGPSSLHGWYPQSTRNCEME
jgi:hypothetical protein